MDFRIAGKIFHFEVLKTKVGTALQTIRMLMLVILTIFSGLLPLTDVSAAQLRAGIGIVNITSTESKDFIKDSAYVKALALDNGKTKLVIIGIDKITADDSFVEDVRIRLHQEIGIDPKNILINASHLHGSRECKDVNLLTVLAVKKAFNNMVSVNIGVGTGYENRFIENRRLRLTNGKAWTIRHANPLPPDEEVASIGPIDPEIGILRLDKKNGETLAVVYNFASHTYQGVSAAGITAGYPGFASKIIEDNLGGAMAVFLQGACGDIIPVLYKDVNSIRDQEPMGNMLGFSTLKALKTIECKKNTDLNVINETIKMPRRTDLDQKIESLEAEKKRLLESLRGTSLNFKTFFPLYIKYNIFEQYPSYYSHRYLHEEMTGRSDLKNLDNENERNIAKYLRNINSMEKLTRIQENLLHLRNSKDQNESSGETTIEFEIQAMRIGDFILVTYPGDLVVEIGLNIKKSSPHEFTFISGHSNGVIGYGPTAEYYNGEAYEDSYCILAPEWQKIYEEKVLEILKKI